MLVPQDSPCPECGHARRDHEISVGAGGGGQCIHCDRTATTIYTQAIIWNPDAPAHPFDWNFALVTFVMELESDEGLFTDTIEKWRPGYALAPGEREELREIEVIVRELWKRYGPQKPPPATIAGRNVLRENAVMDEWRSYFPAAEHARLERALREHSCIVLQAVVRLTIASGRELGRPNLDAR